MRWPVFLFIPENAKMVNPFFMHNSNSLMEVTQPLKVQDARLVVQQRNGLMNSC
jgi:hypothetical protein